MVIMIWAVQTIDYMTGCWAQGSWSLFAAGTAFYGWWTEDVTDRGNSEQFSGWAVNEIDTKNKGAAVLVLIEEGVSLHRFFQGDVDENILFPTASFSKWMTAFSTMSLIEENRVELDVPI